MFEDSLEYQEGADLAVNQYMSSVYKWMTLALLVSGMVAWHTANSPALIETFLTGGTFWVLVIAQFAAVIALSAAVTRMSMGAAIMLFLGYSALTGLTISTIFLAFTASSITKVFLITAGTFAGLSMYGYSTKKDLSGWGSFLFMSLIGLIIASVVNIFFRSPAVEWITAYGGVIIFAGLTAYDTQKLKYLGQTAMTEDSRTKLAIRGALTLYLDFINLFLHLLRVMGSRD